ncbi:MAG: CRISPR-associated protein Cas4 [Desulfovibrio sp.]|jgi:CRISPR-associated exonuclease Cas4|nr:CRISPR-associated protein Cas4 [Desulfovibrio sp.]
MVAAFDNAEDLIQLSALQHYIYCPRRCILIHMEQEWAENVFTAEGRVLHEKADSGQREKRRDLRVETGVLLRSNALGLSGKADVVEFHRIDGNWLPFPVEYKRGRPKKDDTDRVQLCAQALCLEEMLNCDVPKGALFYGSTRRRQDVLFTEALRQKTRDVAVAVRMLFSQNTLPQPPNDSRCEHCSLRDACLPEVKRNRAARYIDALCGQQ